MLQLVCWKWEPLKSAPTTKKKQSYTSAHVNALYTMLQQNVSLPFKLICVTDDPAGIDPAIKIIPLWKEFRNLGGCFVRLVCFKKNFKLFGERFFSIDLDCVITENIDHLFSREEPFIIWSPDESDLSRRSVNYCGSLFGLTVGIHPEIYDEFRPSKLKRNKRGRYSGGSDQKHISKVVKDAIVFGQKEGIYNFMPDLSPLGHKLPDNCSLVFFNGGFLPDDPGLKSHFSWVAKHYPLAGKGKEVYNSAVVARKRNRIATSKYASYITYVLFWWGNWPVGDEKLGRLYINRLVAGIKKHTPTKTGYNIVLFTDRPRLKFEDVDVRLLNVPNSLRWNLKKMYMYSPKANLRGAILCLDLDCVIVNNLSRVINQVFKMQNKRLITCAGAYRKGRIGGSVIGFHVGPKIEKILWTPIMNAKFREQIETVTKGSERKYYQFRFKARQVMLWERVLPGSILSYKRDCKETLSKFGIIVRFHGKPRPHEVQVDWLKEHWG